MLKITMTPFNRFMNGNDIYIEDTMLDEILNSCDASAFSFPES